MNRSSKHSLVTSLESLLPGSFTKLYVLKHIDLSNLSNHQCVHLSHPSNFERIQAIMWDSQKVLVVLSFL